MTSCKKSNESILRETAVKLKSIESIEYRAILEILQKNVGLDEVDTALCFFDFKSADSFLGPRYHILIKHIEDVFNGKTFFSVDKNEKRIIYINKPRIEQVNSSFFMTNSIYLINKLLLELLIDPSSFITRQNDTLVNGEKNYSFNISIKDKARYMKLGLLITEEKWETPNYKLFISKKNYLPTQIIDIYPNNGYWKSTFSNIHLSTSRSDSIWEYDRFPQDYLRMSGREFAESMKAKAFIKVGEIAPNWSLSLVSGNSIQLSDLKGSLVLLEFWFPYCGGCVQAIPEINNIHDSYSNKNLKVYGIEFTRSDNKTLEDYIREQGIKYPTLYKGQAVAKDFGVNAAPTFFLIDKKGFIVYSSVGLYKDDLIKTINDNI
jgi:thiol-disulfide isomerase/thioredoxin